MFDVKKIATIENDFVEKFGIPRQSGLAEHVVSKIVFESEYRDANALRGLEDYSHIWLLWLFSENIKKSDDVKSPEVANSSNSESEAVGLMDSNSESKAVGLMDSNSENKNVSSEISKKSESKWHATVRPPRLGGNKRVGVFATRSPFRPNPIGMSCVKIVGIQLDTPEGPVIYVSGADLMNGTPILDIKPYLPYVDCHPDAKGSFSEEKKDYRLKVEFTEEAIRDIEKTEVATNQAEAEKTGTATNQAEFEKAEAAVNLARTEKTANVIELAKSENLAGLIEILSLDPRPSYQNDPERVYGLTYGDYDVKFKVSGDTLYVLEICEGV